MTLKQVNYKIRNHDKYELNFKSCLGKVASFFLKLHRYTIATSSALIQNTRGLAQASVYRATKLKMSRNATQQ